MLFERNRCQISFFWLHLALSALWEEREECVRKTEPGKSYAKRRLCYKCGFGSKEEDQHEEGNVNHHQFQEQSRLEKLVLLKYGEAVLCMIGQDNSIWIVAFFRFTKAFYVYKMTDVQNLHQDVQQQANSHAFRSPQALEQTFSGNDG